MRGWTVAVLAMAIFGLGFAARAISGHPADQPSWQTIYQNDENGATVAGSKPALIAAVRSGKPVRVYWAGGRVEHAADAVFLTIFDNEVFAQLPRIRAQRPSRPGEPSDIELLDPDAEWTAILSTSGGYAVSWAIQI